MYQGSVVPAGSLGLAVMPDSQATDSDQCEEEPGWRVLDPDGTVVASGPGIVLEAVAHTGEEQ